MSRDARKKQKHQLKRRQKQAQARKAAAITPLDRIAKSGGTLECHVNADWRESGMANVQVLGQAADGRLAHAAFLVDVWCVGLKDAYGHRTIARADFEDQLDRMSEMLDIVRIPAAEAKRLVAGGIRFARQNGFHLPPHHDRWTAIFGDLGDVASADLADFGVDGGLRYIGTEDFLRRRLSACTPEQFLSRPDVNWVMYDGTPRTLGDRDALQQDDALEDEGNQVDSDGSDEELLAALQEMIGSTGGRIEDAVRVWCSQTGQPPHPRLREAVATLLVSTVPLAAVLEAGDEAAAGLEDVPAPDELVDEALHGLPEGERRSIEEAMDQVNSFMRQFESPRDMLAAVHAEPPHSAGGGALPAS